MQRQYGHHDDHVYDRKAGNTLALIPDNGYPRSEYSGDKRTHGISWRCGLSHMNRQGELSPTLYYPVLGQEGSEKQAGDSVRFGFRVSMTDKGWYEAHKHAVYDIYGLGNSLALKHTTLPLYKRMEAIWDYILDDSLSFWRTAGYKGLTIGAQDYLGGVVEADRDAMKNSDIGASWMLASMTGDPRLTEERLPYMRNFKLMQQAPAGDPNHGAAMGQYYLWKSKSSSKSGATISNRSASRTIRSWTWATSCSSNGTTRCCAAVSGPEPNGCCHCSRPTAVLPWPTANTTGNRCSPT